MIPFLTKVTYFFSLCVVFRITGPFWLNSSKMFGPMQTFMQKRNFEHFRFVKQSSMWPNLRSYFQKISSMISSYDVVSYIDSYDSWGQVRQQKLRVDLEKPHFPAQCSAVIKIAPLCNIHILMVKIIYCLLRALPYTFRRSN